MKEQYTLKASCCYGAHPLLLGFAVHRLISFRVLESIQNFHNFFFFFEHFWKKLGKKNSKWLFWMPNGMFLKKKSWNFEKIHVFKISYFCRNRNYRTFPTSTTPKGKIRFVGFHMMSHLIKISFEPIYVPWESNISVDPSGWPLRNLALRKFTAISKFRFLSLIFDILCRNFSSI